MADKKRTAKAKAHAAAAAPAQQVKSAPARVEAELDAAAEAAAAQIVTNSNQINEGIQIMKNETIQATEFANDRAKAIFGDVNERAKSAMEKNARIVEEATELTKGNVEALVASSKIAARGFETLSQEVAEYGRKSFEEASTAFKSFADVKSPTDLFKLQSEYAKTAFDSVVAESSKLSEAMIKLSGEMFEPITSRYSVAAERVKNVVVA